MTTGYKFKHVDLGYFLDLSRTGSNYFKESGTNLTPISTDALGTLTDVEKINVGFGYEINGVSIKNVSKSKSQLFETPGAYTLNAATYGDVTFRALIVGGGGGGGGGGGNIGGRSDGQGGNAGGSGGALISNYMTMNEGLTLTVGAGGSGGKKGGDMGTATGDNSGEAGAAGGDTFISNNNWGIRGGGGGGGGPGGSGASATIGGGGGAEFYTPYTTATRALYTQIGISGGKEVGLDGGVGYAAGDVALKSSYSTTFPASKSVGANGGNNNDNATPAPSGNYGGGGGGGGGTNQGNQPSKGGNGGNGYAILWFYPNEQS